VRAKLRYRAEAALAGAGIGLFRALGPERASDFGGALLRHVGPHLGATKVAERNLCAAMPELCAGERRAIIADVWENLGRTVAELPHLCSLRETGSGPGYEGQGFEILDGLAQTGGPSLFFSGHIGNWEMLGPAAAQHGTVLGTIYRAAKNPLVDAMIQRLRTQACGGRPAPMFAKGAEGGAQAFRSLARGGHLAMLVDQKLNDGIMVPFFGMDAPTAPALANFALRFRCKVIPARALRIGPARFRILVEAPLALPDSGDRTADIRTLTIMMNQVLERWIREQPGSWLWLHRRWPKGFV
jgi:Kdo2-lipid IVA lauroyltransferase/acyltransferase